MPTIWAQGKQIECEVGDNLRQVLLAADVSLYSPRSHYVNCMGIGTCGTCAVEIEGPVSEVNWRDRARRSLPPHSPERPLRLACQTRVLGDIRVTRYQGFWGHKSDTAWGPESTGSELIGSEAAQGIQEQTDAKTNR